MGKKIGKDCRVALGANTVIGMGTWTMDGVTADQMEATEFNDDWKSFEFGAKDGGTVTFSGLFDPEDETGQDSLRRANMDNTDITSLRLYTDDTSYFEPCQTTFWWSGTSTTGEATVYSWVNITAINIGADKAALMTIDFTAKVSGLLVHV